MSEKHIIDPQQARAAYEALSKTFDAIPSEKLARVSVEVQLAAVHAYGIAERDSAPERSSEFEKLARADVIAANPVGRLKQRALAAWYARQQQLRFTARSGAVVPAVVTEAGEAVKKRMFKVVTHAFGDHSDYAVDLAAIRQGQGYLDLANDLQQLADLYEEPVIAAVVSKDPIHYKKTDVKDARAHAAAIFKALGYESSDAAQWTARAQRAYTVLLDAYEEHCYAGSLLFHQREDVTASYPPSLVSIIRASPTRGDAQVPVADEPTPTT
jgi:hypothetical protein